MSTMMSTNVHKALTRLCGWAAPVACLCGLLASCGGSDTAANQPPVPVINSPAAAATYRAGDTVTFNATATDAEDGTLTGSRLAWWAEFHHDTHTHPFLPEVAGGSGSAAIPVRGEVSDNVFYRFHFRATDSAGATVEVTRDVVPQKAQITLATLPAGLGLTLDGQPVTAPHAVTGVVGLERDLGATNQNFNGRRYQFSNWSDGGTASHTVSTPAANTTYTATFTDIGPVNNQPPTVTLTAPANGSTGTVGTPITLSATATDSDGTVARVEFLDGATVLVQDTTTPYSLSWTPTTMGAHNLTARATDDTGAVTTSAARTVNINPSGADTLPPTVTISAPANFASGIADTLTFSADATDNVGVTNVEFQVDGVAAGSDATAPYSVSVDSNAYASGQHVLRVRASDAAGNQSAWTTATVEFGGSRTQPSGFTRNESYVTGLSSATAFAQAPDGRLFVSQQGGAMRVVKNNALLAAPFMTLSVDANGERGLLGVALHPNFAANNLIYAYYTTTSGGTHNRISRFTASGDTVVPGSEQVLVELPALSGATNHNGGAIHFGIDGKLYVGVGENANTANSQDLSTPLGKMLRFNDDGTIPGDNPFCTTPGNLACAVWAYGLRNPFTFAVQPGTGRIHINDVGAGTWEEINLGTPGANYGWPGSEGPTNVTGGITGPLFTYKHSAASPAGSGPGGFFIGFSIAGGAFYPSTGNFPAQYRGNYFFADYVSTFVGLIDLANGNAAYSFGKVSGSPVDMLVASDGALLVLTRSGIVRFSAP
jgi:glucose/arabinose dehydrogenase